MGDHCALEVVESGLLSAVFIQVFVQWLLHHLMKSFAIFFQVFLKKLEKVFVFGFVHKISKGIRPFEDLSALHDLVQRLNKEFQFAQRVVLDLMQKLDFAFD